MSAPTEPELPPLAASLSKNYTTQIVMPMHVNGAGGIMFGGIVVSWIDVCAGVSAMRHAGGPVVTASIDRLDFITPIRLGELVVLQSQVNFASRTSMEVGCRVETEDPRTRVRRYTTKAYLTFVAVGEGGKPRPVPPLVCESDSEIRRCRDAESRRAERLRLRLHR